jgi:hypothetical protein
MFKIIAILICAVPVKADQISDFIRSRPEICSLIIMSISGRKYADYPKIGDQGHPVDTYDWARSEKDSPYLPVRLWANATLLAKEGREFEGKKAEIFPEIDWYYKQMLRGLEDPMFLAELPAADRINVKRLANRVKQSVESPEFVYRDYVMLSFSFAIAMSLKRSMKTDPEMGWLMENEEGARDALASSFEKVIADGLRDMPVARTPEGQLRNELDVVNQWLDMTETELMVFNFTRRTLSAALKDLSALSFSFHGSESIALDIFAAANGPQNSLLYFTFAEPQLRQINLYSTYPVKLIHLSSDPWTMRSSIMSPLWLAADRMIDARKIFLDGTAKIYPGRVLYEDFLKKLKEVQDPRMRELLQLYWYDTFVFERTDYNFGIWQAVLWEHLFRRPPITLDETVTHDPLVNHLRYNVLGTSGTLSREDASFVFGWFARMILEMEPSQIHSEVYDVFRWSDDNGSVH